MNNIRITILPILTLFFTALSAEHCTNENELSGCTFFKYVRFNGHLYTETPEIVTPGISFGGRYFSKGNALDISFGFAGANKDHEESKFIFCPRALLLKYANPYCSSSLYGGMGFGYLAHEYSKKSQEYDFYYADQYEKEKCFNGLSAEFALGYEFMRLSSIRSFIELNLSQPLVKTDYSNSYAPVVQVGMGFGY